MAFIDVRSTDGKSLLFRFDPARDLVEVKHKNGAVHLVDLQQYREGQSTDEYRKRSTAAEPAK